jgi:hypothetical protein
MATLLRHFCDILGHDTWRGLEFIYLQNSSIDGFGLLWRIASFHAMPSIQLTETVYFTDAMAQNLDAS